MLTWAPSVHVARPVFWRWGIFKLSYLHSSKPHIMQTVNFPPWNFNSKISIPFLGFKCLTLWIWELIFCNSPHTVHVHRFICMLVTCVHGHAVWAWGLVKVGTCVLIIYIVVLGNNIVTAVVYPSHANSKNTVLAMQILSEIILQPACTYQRRCNKLKVWISVNCITLCSYHGSRMPPCILFWLASQSCILLRSCSTS